MQGCGVGPSLAGSLALDTLAGSRGDAVLGRADNKAGATDVSLAAGQGAA